MNISWDAEGYERGFSFVPAYGAGVIDLIDVCPGEKCLDLGCGNGTLTAELAACGPDASGVDASPEMVALARERHPELRFEVGDATSFSLDEPVDVVFSNALGRADRRGGGRAGCRLGAAAGRCVVCRLRAPAHACRQGGVGWLQGACPRRAASALNNLGLWQSGGRDCLGIRGYGSSEASSAGEKYRGRASDQGLFSPRPFWRLEGCLRAAITRLF